MANSDVPAPTPVDLARNLAADLAIVEYAPPGPWHHDPANLWAMVTTQPDGGGGFVARALPVTVSCRRYGERETAAAIAAMRGAWPAAIRRALHAEARVDQLQREFDLRWKATQRAIDRWRAEDPAGRKLEQPDHADLCCWLMDRMTTVEAECKRLRDELATERTVLRRTADALTEFADSVHRQELTYALVAALRNRLETGGHTNG